jgi:hypothetical protein
MDPIAKLLLGAFLPETDAGTMAGMQIAAPAAARRKRARRVRFWLMDISFT